MTSRASPLSTEPESGVIDGVRWARLIPYRSPLLDRFRRLPDREFQAIRHWASGFYSFQRPWVFDFCRFAHAVKARQIGWSYSTAGWIALLAVFGGEVTTIVSDKEKSALATLAKVKDHARILRKFHSEYARTVKSNDEEVYFSSGGGAIAFTSKGSRSFTGNLCLDEFAYHANPEAVWEASAPTITTGTLRMRVMSTPNGTGNAFHDRTLIAKKRGSGWHYYDIPIETAIAAGYPVDLEDCRTLTNNDPRLFAQVYQCSFLDNVLQYIPHERIAAAQSDDVALFDRRGPGLFYAGLDIGETSDRTVLTVLRHYQGVSYPVHVESIARTSWDAMDSMVAWAFREYNLRRLCIDKSGLGTFPAQKMQQLHGDVSPVDYRRNRVEMIKFTKESKEILATQLFQCLGDGSLALPQSDASLPAFTRRDRSGALAKGEEIGPAILVNAPSGGDDFIGTARLLSQEIGAVQRVVTEHGNVTYVSPKTKEGHGDHAWSLALATHAVDTVHPAVAALQLRLGLTTDLKKKTKAVA